MNLDVLAHMMFGPILFLVSAVLILDFLRKIKTDTVIIIYGCISTAIGFLYFLLLNTANISIFNLSEVDTGNKQHLVISISLMLFGLIILTFAKSKRIIPISIISTLLLVVGLIFMFHSHPDGIEHAEWLTPYHQVIAVILIISSVSGFLAYTLKKLEWLKILVAIIFVVLGVMLLFYHDPYEQKVLEECIKTGKDVTVQINETEFSTKYIEAKRCDVLNIVATDTNGHIIAFGEHSHHSSYGDYEESLVSKGKNLKIVLSQSGKYLVHDHEDEDISTTINIEEN